LPAEWTSFVGRRRERADIKGLISEHRLVTLTGVAGVGKSRLARRAADQLVRAAPGGVWWVELDPVTDPALVPQAVLQALDLDGGNGAGPQARLVDFLSERPAILVLDNCEHVIEAVAALVDTLLSAVAELRILATSREVLRAPGEHVLPVEPLRVPAEAARSPATLSAYPAVALFCQRAAAAVPGFTLTPTNAAAVAGICRRLDGLPLAIELAAVRLRALSPEQILNRLDDQLDLLVTGPRTASARQRTLRGALDWSYELCTPAERTVWAQLSVFTGGFDLAAAEQVCSPDPTEPHGLDGAIDGLVGKSILMRTEERGLVRFRLLDTLGRYGREKLGCGEAEAALRARHANWYARLARRAAEAWFSPSEMMWLARLRTEHANLRTALEFLLASCDGAQRALGMVGDLWFYWTNAAPVTEAEYWLGRALARDPAPTPARARALWVAAYVATIRYDVDAALRYIAEGEEVATAVGDAEALGWTAARAGVLLMMLEDLPMSNALAEEALARFEAAGVPDGSGAVLARIHLAFTRLMAGDVEGARQMAEQCRTICATKGERTLRGTALLILARASWMRGELRAATGYAGAALRLRIRLPSPTTLTLALELLGWIAASAGDLERVAVLQGGIDEVRRALGTALVAGTPALVRPHDEAVTMARAKLGDDGYTRAYERGAAMGTDELVGYALGEKPRRETGSGAAEPALTAREQQIADLVAIGLSNRQIASKLVISQRTAETHIEHVLRKLNFSSRAQIAAWAAGRHPHPGPPVVPP
jgi:predicted ATPase/DNA-binding CsgD family transcriptional regulator